jgi:hypothetical protein
LQTKVGGENGEEEWWNTEGLGEHENLTESIDIVIPVERYTLIEFLR